jgi:glycoprotein endo-alpha-1,2-mannosidase
MRGLVFFLGLLRTSSELTFPKSVHAFFYLWYGNPQTDGAFKHWDHELLPHWNEAIRKQYPTSVRFRPPELVHSPFYPRRGPYSSKDLATLREQMEEMKASGIDVAAVSWWGRPDQPGTTDTQGVSTDNVIPVVLEAAAQANMKIAFHLEPYVNRTSATVRLDIQHIRNQYGNSPALMMHEGRPLYYVYDSYHIKADDWATIFDAKGASTVRGTDLDGIFLALWLNEEDKRDIIAGSFDGSYTYFASAGFSYGSNPRGWRQMSEWSRKQGKLFIPSVGPGYIDIGIRPWNAHNTKSREDGRYYDRMWEHAVGCDPSTISITSYNEWGEGTQIEPAVAKRRVALPATKAETKGAAEARGAVMDEQILQKIGLGGAYEDYGEGGPDYYLTKTRAWAARY